MNKRIKWTQSMLDYLRKNYPVDSAESVAKHLGISVQIVYSKASRLDIKKSSEYFQERNDKTSPAPSKFSELINTRHGVVVVHGNSRVHTMR